MVPLHPQFLNKRQAKGVLEENRPGCVCLRVWGVNLDVLSREIRRTQALFPNSTSTPPLAARTLCSQGSKMERVEQRGEERTQNEAPGPGQSSHLASTPGLAPKWGSRVPGMTTQRGCSFLEGLSQSSQCPDADLNQHLFTSGTGFTFKPLAELCDFRTQPLGNAHKQCL